MAAVTDVVTLHITKDMVPVFTVEPEVHPHAENVQPQVCATKPQWVLCRGSRQACIPCQKCVKKTASTHLMSCTSTNMMITVQMFNLVYIS